MALVGITPSEALQLCDQLQSHTDTMRSQLGVLGQNISDLASAHYISATMTAFHTKFESESRQQLTDVLNRADEAVMGTREVIRVQMERQESAGAAINKY